MYVKLSSGYWAGSRHRGSVILTHRGKFSGASLATPSACTGLSFPGATWRGDRGDVEKKLGLAFLTLAFSSSSQHSDRHKLGLCLGGHPVWACRLLQRAALPTLETVHKFRQPATCVRLPFLPCRLPWRPQRGVNVLLHWFWNTDLSLSLLKKKENQTRKHTKSIKAITPYKPTGPLKKPLPSSCLQAEQIITLPQGRKVLIKAIH